MIRSRKNVKRHILTYAIPVLILFISACTNLGGGSGTGNANTIAGILMRPGGSTPAQCNVYLYRADGIPVISDSVDTNIISLDSTNKEGRFVFRKIPDGMYNIFCIDTVASFSKLIFNVIAQNKDSLFTGIDTMRVNRELSGRVNNTQGIQTIAFIYGSPFITLISNASGFFTLSGLPSGDTTIVTFKALELVDAKTCQTEYKFTQLPDTTMYVTVSLECN